MLLKVSYIFCLLTILNVTRAAPNIVIFLADDLGYGDVGCFGNNTIRTPGIDSLAKNGVKLNHHLTAAAVCTPSRAALLTGRYAIRSGMETSNRNKVFFFVAATGGLPQNETTFAKKLKGKGYSTAIIGKWHLGSNCNKGDGCHHPLNHGFDYFYGLPLSNFKDFGSDGQSVITTYDSNFYSYIIAIVVCGVTLPYFLLPKHKKLSIFVIIFMVITPALLSLFLLNLKTINGVVMRNTDVVEQPIKLNGLTQQFVKEAKLFLSTSIDSKKPFLLYMPFVHVHTALFSSAEFHGSRHGRYGDNIEELDWAIGEILSTLKSLHVINNTFIYFSSDNGGHVEEIDNDGQREGGYNGIFRGGKTMAGFEGGIRVPSIISWEGHVSKDTELNATTSQMDLYPTLMELAEIPLPDDRIIDGKSLIPLLHNGTVKSPHEFLFHYCGRAIHACTYISGRNIWKIHWITPKFLPGTNRCGYVCHCFGDFVVHHNPPLLYDLVIDPSESHILDVASNPTYSKIVYDATEAKKNHEMTVEKVPNQFSFLNTIWRPWLQPCCNFPYCKCVDPLRVT